jgi:pyroglutamyl-peptidase
MARGRAKTVLVTGFGAFPGAPVNPTEALVSALRRAPPLPGLGLELKLLPVVWAEAPALLRHFIAEAKPDAVVMFGLAGRSRTVRIEVLAVNRTHPTALDAEGALAASDRLDPAGPDSLRARCDAAALRRAVAALGVPVRLSRDAGTYLCNAALWTALAATEETVPVALVHVPPAERLAEERLVAVARAVIGAVAG